MRVEARRARRYRRHRNLLRPGPRSQYAHFHSCEDLLEWLSLFREAAASCGPEGWVVYLEPDVLVRGLIRSYPVDAGCGGKAHAFNRLTGWRRDWVERKRASIGSTELAAYYYGTAGGCCLHGARCATAIAACRVEKGGFNITSTCDFSDEMRQGRGPLFENSTRDELSSKNESKRVKTDRDTSLERSEKITLFRPRPRAGATSTTTSRRGTGTSCCRPSSSRRASTSGTGGSSRRRATSSARIVARGRRSSTTLSTSTRRRRRSARPSGSPSAVPPRARRRGCACTRCARTPRSRRTTRRRRR